MSRRLLLWVLAASLVSCGDDPAGTSDAGVDAPDLGDVEAPATWCEGLTAQRYDPLGGAELESWPDDFYTRDDAASPTGLWLDVTSETAPWVDGTSTLVRSSFVQLNRLSGFGTGTGILLRFSDQLGELPSSADESLTSPGLMLLDLSVDPPERVPYAVQSMSDQGDLRDLIIWPLRPLRPKGRHAVVMTTDLLAADGQCVAPSETMRALLTGDVSDPRLERLAPRYAQLIEATGLAPEAISAATVFTTHGDLDVLAEVAADVRFRETTWSTTPECTTGSTVVSCVGVFEAFDYRDDLIITEARPGDSWDLTVRIWLPAGPGGPWPILVLGHGLGDSAESFGGAVADVLTSMGVAVVAVDALEHGEHPTAQGGDTQSTALRFLGIETQPPSIDTLRLRGNFNQSNVDRLQVIELLRAEPDVDGDGEDDLDPERLGYLGVSLGGMMGSGLLALNGDIDAALLSVAGGGLLTFVTDNAAVAPLKPLIVTMVGSEAELDRLLVVAESLIDAGDPATFGPFVLGDRLVGEQVPDVLFQVAVEDETVPPASGQALARALDIPHVGTVIDPVDLIPLGAALPLSGNVAGGEATAGFFQFDRISTGGGGVRAAGHTTTTFSPEGLLQAAHFFETWLDTGLGEILDPYQVLDTPALP